MCQTGKPSAWEWFEFLKGVDQNQPNILTHRIYSKSWYVKDQSANLHVFTQVNKITISYKMFGGTQLPKGKQEYKKLQRGSVHFIQSDLCQSTHLVKINPKSKIQKLSKTACVGDWLPQEKVLGDANIRSRN